MTDSPRLRDFIASLSLANLLFLKVWLWILPYKSGAAYFLEYSPRNSYLAAMANVLLYGVALFFVVRLCRRREDLFSWLVPLLFIGIILLDVNGISGFYGLAKPNLHHLLGAKAATVVRFLVLAAGIALFYLLLRYRRRVAASFTLVPLLFSPFICITFGQSLLALGHIEPSSQFYSHTASPASPLRNPLKTGVVWIIFDETDYRLCFKERPAGLSLPEFDRFAQSALSSTEAYSPSDNTKTSLPSLLTGIPLRTAVPVAARKLELIRSDSGASLDFTSQDTIFKEVHKRGGSTALFGWYHPYLRGLGDIDLGRDFPQYNYHVSDNFLTVLFFQTREIFESRLSPFDKSFNVSNQTLLLQGLHAGALDALGHNDTTFTFLHYPVPHAPNIYDRRTGAFVNNRNVREGYFDNVALADRCLSDLRLMMEQRGIWDSSLVIISSDHHWRMNTYDGIIDRQHVPFMVKMPFQHRPVTYAGRFNTVATKNLVLDVLDGKVTSPEEAAAWLDRRGEGGARSDGAADGKDKEEDDD